MNRNLQAGILWLVLIALLFTAAVVYGRVATRETQGEDIYYTWIEGQRLLNGENPYARVLSGNMRENQKYATYLPMFYLFSAASQWAGLHDYSAWVSAWRIVFAAFDMAVAALVFWLLYTRRLPVAALFGAAFCLFNRWTLHVIQVADMDHLAIFLFLLALALFDRHRRVSFLVFGVSLAVKQIAIFAVPLILIWTWHSAEVHQRRRALAEAVVLIASVAAVVSLPFLIWNAEGFVKSIVFSATRNPADHFGAPSVDGLLGWIGIPAKVPMLLMMVLVYLLAWRRQVGLFIGTFFLLVSFTDFNSVLFRQYMAWVVPFVPLVLVDVADGRLQLLPSRPKSV